MTSSGAKTEEVIAFTSSLDCSDDFFNLDIDAIFAYYEKLDCPLSYNSEETFPDSSQNATYKASIPSSLSDNGIPKTQNDLSSSGFYDQGEKSIHSEPSDSSPTPNETVNSDMETSHLHKNEDTDSISLDTNKLDLETLIKQSPDESRIDYLMRLPRLYQLCVNSGEFDLFSTLLNECCTPELLIKMTPSLPPQVGPEFLVAAHASCMESAPDYVLSLGAPILEHRIMCCSSIVSGTQICEVQNEELWNFGKYKFGKEDDTQAKMIRQKYHALAATGQPIKWIFYGTFYFILNKAKTHVEKYILVRNDVRLHV